MAASGGFLRIPDQICEFVRESGPGRRRMLALTYEFTPKSFERLCERVFGMGVEVDVVVGKPLDGPVSGYRVWQANWRGTFHPKAIIAVAGGRVQVGLGSANLTSGGLGNNLEAWSFFTEREGREVLCGMRRVLSDLIKKGIIPEAVGAEFMAALPEGATSTVFSTLDGSLCEQVRASLGRKAAKVSRLDIVSPLHADASKVVAELQRLAPTAVIGLYTDGSAAEIPTIRGVSEFHSLRGPNVGSNDVATDEEGGRALERMHAKLYAFRVGREVHLFWGSANLSISAWLAKGPTANLELLVSSRVSKSEWSLLLNRLPHGHKWERVSPKASKAPVVDEWRPLGFCLLHASWDGADLTVYSTRSGTQRLDLRAYPGGRMVPVTAEFSAGIWQAPTTHNRALGFLGNDAPAMLEWRRPGGGTWAKIPVNRLAMLTAAGADGSLSESLFALYAGKPFPKPGASLAPPDSERQPPELSPEEDELTRSPHQGELDRFVLAWRLTADAIRRSSGSNEPLRRFRIQDALARIRKDAARNPANWQAYRIRFAQSLLERRWRD